MSRVQQRVLALQGGDRVHGVRPAEGVGRGLGQPEVADLAGLDQLGHGADRVLDRHGRVDAVQVVEVDVVDAEAQQRHVARLPARSPGRPSTPAPGAVRAVDDAELRGQHDLVAPARDGPADELLVVPGP